MYFDDAAAPSVSFNDTLETSAPNGSLSGYLRECERNFIMQSLNQYHWHFGNTATALDITRKDLWEKMKKLNIQNMKISVSDETIAR